MILRFALLAALGCAPPTDSGPGGPRRDSGGRPDSADSGLDPVDSADSADSADPAGTCGDDAVDGPHEECDGAADDACPGRCASTCQCPSLPASGTLELDMIDVWQGDGLLLVSPAGFVTLVDAGLADEYPAVADFLAARGVPGLDYTLVSHQHADHMGAMGEVLDAHPEVGLAWDGGSTATTQAYADYVAAAGDRRTTVAVGDTLDLGAGVLAEVLHADTGSTDNENLNSVVVRLTVGDVHLLLGGDCEAWGCEDQIDPGPIEVYKVHHHGSDDSSSPRLLHLMQPKVALISVGADNDYGHPNQATLDRLAGVGAEVWRTDEDGSITVTTDGTTWTVAAERR